MSLVGRVRVGRWEGLDGGMARGIGRGSGERRGATGIVRGPVSGGWGLIYWVLFE